MPTAPGGFRHAREKQRNRPFTGLILAVSVVTILHGHSCTAMSLDQRRLMVIALQIVRHRTLPLPSREDSLEVDSACLRRP